MVIIYNNKRYFSMKFKFKMHLIATVLLSGLMSFTLTSQAATYNYTTLDHPNATGFTYANGINDSGQVTGTFQDATGIHGFLYDPIANTYSTLDHPDANAGSTVAFGINDNGQVIGTFYNGTGGINSNPHFFVFDGNAYTTLDFAGNGVPAENFATGINNSGQVTGYFQDGWGAPWFCVRRQRLQHSRPS